MSKFVVLLIVLTAVICSAEVPKEAGFPSGKLCKPGSSWRSQCNNCMCTIDGKPGCTRAMCVGDEHDPYRTCAPGTTWKDDCNTCSCTSGHAECTKMACPKPPSQCLKPIVAGKCDANITRYGYNTETKKCELFTYGGCGGNSNNFETKAECKKTCISG